MRPAAASGGDSSKRMTILIQTGLGASEAGKSPEEDALQRSGVRLWAGSGPRKRRLAGWRDGRRVHRQLQVPQNFSDDTALGHRRDDPQRALLPHRTARHNYRHSGDNPVRLYSELCEVIDDVIRHLEVEGRSLPRPRIRPMQEVV